MLHIHINRETEPSTLQPLCHLGAFLHSTSAAPIITMFIPGTPLKTTHLQKHA